MCSLVIGWKMGQEEKKIVVAVIGPAGCGKSLLVQALSSSDGKACHSKHVDNGARHCTAIS